MEHYWGAKAIVQRLGYRDHRHLATLKLKHDLPAFLRPDPRCPWRRLYYSNESLLTLWELAKSKADTERLWAEQEAKAEAKRLRHRRV